MANWDFVLAYDEEAASWLRSEGFVCPPVQSRNRLPSEDELSDAVAVSAAEPPTVVVGTFGLSTAQPYFTIRGDFGGELAVLLALSQICGQFFVYPDTGDPAFVIEPSMDAEHVRSVLCAARSAEDPWRHVFDTLYRLSP